MPAKEAVAKGRFFSKSFPRKRESSPYESGRLFVQEDHERHDFRGRYVGVMVRRGSPNSGQPRHEVVGSIREEPKKSDELR